MKPLKIWIDVMTPKQALFFTPLVRDLVRRGHTTRVTSRHYREAEGMIRKIGLTATFVGKHGGGSLVDKLIAGSERIRALADLVPQWAPDLALHFASPECARVSFGLRIPQICVSDCPHTVAVDRLTMPLADRLMTPWVIPYSAWSRYGITRDKISRYKALDPAAWLKRTTPAPLNISEIGADPKRKTITLRYEESQAAYLLDKDRGWGTKILDGLTSNFPDHNVIVLSRYEEQIEQLERECAGRAVVVKEIVDGAALLKATDLFVGMGGTMTMEAALLGVPTISAYQGGDLYYISYLVRAGLVTETANLSQLLKQARSLLTDQARKRTIERRAVKLLSRMEDPVERIVYAIEHFKLPS